jgi:hypothetical protein
MSLMSLFLPASEPIQLLSLFALDNETVALERRKHSQCRYRSCSCSHTADAQPEAVIEIEVEVEVECEVEV